MSTLGPAASAAPADLSHSEVPATDGHRRKGVPSIDVRRIARPDHHASLLSRAGVADCAAPGHRLRTCRRSFGLRYAATRAGSAAISAICESASQQL